MALQEVLNSSIWVIKDDKSNYQPLYGQFLYALNTDASGDDDKGMLYVGNGTEWINVMGTALQDVIENILATVPFEQIDNKTIFDAINEKANKATTLEGYGIEDAYTKTTIDAIILALEAELAGKQGKLTAGDNISIDGNKISVGLDQVDNTSDANKPISTATQAALDLKADKSQVASELAGKQDKLPAGTNITITGTTISAKDTTYTAGTNIAISDAKVISVTGLTKASVGLGNVDNTSDANKPISTATQTALDAKQNVANLVTSIDSSSDDTHYPSAKAVYTAIDGLQDEVTSTVETTVTPTTAQTATAITGALAKKARVVVVPSLANVGAIYIKESNTYSSINPIYPDPTNNVYEFTNMQNVKVFVDSVGDSVDLVIEYRG